LTAALTPVVEAGAFHAVGGTGHAPELKAIGEAASPDYARLLPILQPAPFGPALLDSCQDMPLCALTPVCPHPASGKTKRRTLCPEILANLPVNAWTFLIF
jgi:hypothetical protein